MLDRLREVLEDMVTWSEITESDAKLIWDVSQAELAHYVQLCHALKTKVTALEIEIDGLKKADPASFARVKRAEHNEAIIKQFRLRKGKTP